MLLDYENRNIGVLHKNLEFLQKKLAEKNKIIKSLTETQTAVLDLMSGIREQPHTARSL